MASDSQDLGARPGSATPNEEAEERNKRVSELLDDKDLHELLIQKLQDGGHVAKNPTGEGMGPGAWPQFNGQFPYFPFPPPYWGPTTAAVAAVTNIPLPTSLPTGSASVSGQPGSSSVQGQELDNEEEDSEVEDEDILELLDEGESLELVEFDPTVEKW